MRRNKSKPRKETKASDGQPGRKKSAIRDSKVRSKAAARLIHASFDHPLSAVAENIAEPSTLMQQGTSPNFIISYDPSLGQAGSVIANYLLSACEYDYSRAQPLFGIAPAGLPFQVAVVYSSAGAWHDDPCTNTKISVGALSSKPPDPTFFRMLVLSEVIEVLAATLNNGWACGQSHGEALSRVIPDDLVQWRKPVNYLSAGYWLSSARVDWVDNTKNTDQDYYSIGCGVLFLNWMRFQLNFSWNQIIAAGAPTLAQTYSNITGTSDGYAAFRGVVDSHFPPGIPVNLSSDNVFPLG